MHAESQPSTLLYSLNDRMPHGKAPLVELQHVMAMFIGIITPPLIISRALNFSTAETAGARDECAAPARGRNSVTAA